MPNRSKLTVGELVSLGALTLAVAVIVAVLLARGCGNGNDCLMVIDDKCDSLTTAVETARQKADTPVVSVKKRKAIKKTTSKTPRRPVERHHLDEPAN